MPLRDWPNVARIAKFGIFTQLVWRLGPQLRRREFKMRLSEILKPVDIKIPVESQNKTEAIGELVTLLAQNSELTDANNVLAAVLEREATRTTGIGNGLAIPHGKAAGLDHLVMAIGKPKTPIDFQSIDGKPVTIILLLCSPADQTALISTLWRESAGS
jgi:mannitol/fructose-specific phosphotransferase system IIA component (Ntr-type)